MLAVVIASSYTNSDVSVFCTLFDSNYLDKGLVLHKSLIQCSDDFALYILPMDDTCAQILNDLKLTNVVVLDYYDFEQKQALQNLRSTRSAAEFCWTCTPCLLDYVFNEYNCPICTYIDADLCFFSNPSYAILEMIEAGATVQIVEHGFSDLASNKALRIASGRFCVEFNTFMNEPSARAVLKTWRQQCMASCSASRENGVLGDQGYLDEWPEQFDCVHVCSDPMVGVAPWNADRFRITRVQETVFVEELKTRNRQPLVFYHFHNLAYLSRDVVNIGVFTSFPKCDDSLVNAIYIPYLAELEKAKSLLEDRYGLETLLAIHPAFEQRESRNKDAIMSRLAMHIKAGDVIQAVSDGIRSRFRVWRYKKKSIVVVPNVEGSFYECHRGAKLQSK